MSAQIFNYAAASTSPCLAAMDIVAKCSASSAAFTHTLPDATKCTGVLITVVKVDTSANAVTVATTSSQTIMTTAGTTVTTLSLTTTAGSVSVSLRSDGANWIKVAAT